MVACVKLRLGGVASTVAWRCIAVSPPEMPRSLGEISQSWCQIIDGPAMRIQRNKTFSENHLLKVVGRCAAASTSSNLAHHSVHR